MKYQIVYKNEKVYSTFPCVVYLPENDQVIVAFRQAGSFSVASAARMTPTHHDNDSRCCIISSYDGGMTFDQDSFQIVTEIEFGVNDPGISLLTSGQLILRNTVVEVIVLVGEGPVVLVWLSVPAYIVSTTTPLATASIAAL